MKANTTDLLKFQRLCRRLREPRRGVVGLLELLWNGTAKNAPDGAIGRFSNEEIAIMCDWDGDPDELVAALVESRWLDESAKYRLLVHDWAEHAPKYVHGNLRRWSKEFAREEPTTNGHVDSYLDAATKSSQVKPDNTIDRLGDRPTTEVAYEPETVTPELWAAAVPDFRGVVDDLGKPSMLPEDRESVIRGVLLARRILAPNRFEDVRKRIRRKQRRGELQKPFAYLQTCLRNECKKLDVDFHRARDAITVPAEYIDRNGDRDR